MKPNNLEDSIKAAFGKYLSRFHGQIMPDTRAAKEFASRSFAKSCVWAPGRMIDQVNDMLEAWRKNDTSQGSQSNTALPVIIAAMARDFAPSGSEFGRNVSDAVDVVLPNDPKNRLFKLRTIQADYRVQLAVVAPDSPTARSIASQLHLFVSAIGNRSFFATFSLAGIEDQWGVQIENPDLLFAGTPMEDVKNLTVDVVDLTLRATVPFLSAPEGDEPNDGKGEGTNQTDPFADGYDPSGYVGVQTANGKWLAPGSTIPEKEWAESADITSGSGG